VKIKKRLGQHFLAEHSSIRRIVDVVGIEADDLVVEIGPGQGALTGLLIDRARQVVAIEIDDALSKVLASQFGARIEIISEDVLQVNLPNLVNDYGSDKAILVGNLPYQITGALIRQIISARNVWKRAVIMVQREVGQRMVAPPGTKTYGVLSIVTQVHCVATQLFDLPPSHFYPEPKVYSSVLLLDFETDPGFDIVDENALFRVVRMAFQQRRKMVRNALSGVADSDVLERAGIDGRARPETIRIEGFERICRAMIRQGGRRG